MEVTYLERPGISTLRFIKSGILSYMTEERRILAEHRAIRLLEVDSTNEDDPVDFSGVWTLDMAKEVIKLWKSSGMTQSEFAKANDFPASRFRSKVAIKARSNYDTCL